jgi:hypothetical protein
MYEQREQVVKSQLLWGGSGRNRTGVREAKQHYGEVSMQSWMDGMESNCTTIAIGEALRGEEVNRGKPEQIP